MNIKGQVISGYLRPYFPNNKQKIDVSDILSAFGYIFLFVGSGCGIYLAFSKSLMFGILLILGSVLFGLICGCVSNIVFQLKIQNEKGYILENVELSIYSDRPIPIEGQVQAYVGNEIVANIKTLPKN